MFISWCIKFKILSPHAFIYMATRALRALLKIDDLSNINFEPFRAFSSVFEFFRAFSSFFEPLTFSRIFEHFRAFFSLFEQFSQIFVRSCLTRIFFNCSKVLENAKICLK